jgi:hypothetical protein
MFLFISFSLFSAPEKKDVEKAVNDEIAYQIKSNESGQYWMKLIQNIFESLFKMRSIKDIFFVIFIFIISFLVFMLLFFLLRNITSVNYRSQKTNELEVKHESSIFDIKQLETFIGKGDYSGAVLYIHRCSVFHLMKNQTIFNSNLTNFTIYMKITDNGLKETFRQISAVSEKILFDDYKAVSDDADFCRKLYTSNFI